MMLNKCYNPLKNKYAIEVFVLLLASVLSFFISLNYTSSLEDPLNHVVPYTMNLFFPSVFFASGHGLGTSDPALIPGLEDFLLRRTDHFDVRNIPEDVEVMPVSTPFERVHLYTLYLVGIFWRLFGVSVYSMMLCSAFLSALAGGAIYGIFRIGTSRSFSLTGVLLSVSSPMFLYNANNLRDFAKTPFVLLALYIILFLFFKPATKKNYLFLSGVLGVVLGLAMGIRQDVAMLIPAAVILLPAGCFVKKARPFHYHLLALLLFLIPFFLLSASARRGSEDEGGQAFTHSFFIGLSPDIEERMSFGGASYDTLFWTDANLYAQANVLARRKSDTSSMVNPSTAEYKQGQGDKNAARMINPNLYYTSKKYGKYAFTLFLDYVKHFPADIVMRAWVATQEVHSLSLEGWIRLSRVRADHPPWLKTLFSGQERWARFLKWGGGVLVILFLMGLSAFSLKKAFGLTFLIAWCTGYSSIFFDVRHMSYLSFLSFAIVFTSFATMFRFLARYIKKQTNMEDAGRNSAAYAPSADQEGLLRRSCTRALKNMALFMVTMTLVVILPLIPLRMWQKHQIRDLTKVLAETERIPVTTELVSEAGGGLLVRPLEALPGLPDEDFHEPGEACWEYMAAVFKVHDEDVSVSIVYDPERLFHHSTQSCRIHAPTTDETDRVTLFFPVYEISTVFSPALLETYLQQIQLKAFSDTIDQSRPFADQDIWKNSKFQGISFDARFEECFEGLYRVSTLDGLTYLPFFQLPEQVEHLRYFKQWRK
jgi:hypothetical protein